jgi:undecaprenyl-diphosphatase
MVPVLASNVNCAFGDKHTTLIYMASIEVFILALTQGLTEFLPVSSSGHLLAVRLLFGLSDASGTSFDAFLHLGTLAAVLFYFWPVWAGIIRSLVRSDTEGQDKRELLAKLAIATVPGAIVGYLFQDGLADVLRSAQVLAGALLFTALVLWLFDKISEVQSSIERASFQDALLIGLMQVLALVPGVSRSGMTIAAGRWRGLSRKQATTFSFLLSAPIIAGAGLTSLPTLVAGNGFTLSQLMLGFVISFISGYLAIAGLLKIVERISFMPFIVYLVVLAGVILTYA